MQNSSFLLKLQVNVGCVLGFGNGRSVLYSQHISRLQGLLNRPWAIRRTLERCPLGHPRRTSQRKRWRSCCWCHSTSQGLAENKHGKPLLHVKCIVKYLSTCNIIKHNFSSTKKPMLCSNIWYIEWSSTHEGFTALTSFLAPTLQLDSMLLTISHSSGSATSAFIPYRAASFERRAAKSSAVPVCDP